MLMVRSILFNLAFYANLILQMIVLSPVYFLLPRKKAYRIPKNWARSNHWLMKTIVGTSFEIEGLDAEDVAELDARLIAAGIAHAAGRMVSLTLSDSFCVDRHRDDFLALVSDEVDLLFGNEAELMSLYQTETFFEAVTELRRNCEFAAVTVGARGSIIITGDELIEIAPQPVRRVVDTTGAGDLYAAGFLHGLTSGQPLARCGALGSIAAAEVISHVGPRPLVELRSLVD